MKKLVIFTDNKCKFNIVWNIRNIRSLFQIKYNFKQYSDVIHEASSSCGENYVSEYVRNVRAEHEDPNKQLEPAKHIKYFPDHQFKWRLLTRASKYMRKRKILKAFFN